MTQDEYNNRVRQEIVEILAGLYKKMECSNPQCRYENSDSNSYCVKCGWLLPGRSKKVVINSDEYEELKKKANKSVWEKLKDIFSK